MAENPRDPPAPAVLTLEELHGHGMDFVDVDQFEEAQALNCLNTPTPCRQRQLEQPQASTSTSAIGKPASSLPPCSSTKKSESEVASASQESMPPINAPGTSRKKSKTTSQRLAKEFGWNSIDQLIPPSSKGEGTIAESRIGLVVNSVGTKITLPATIYQYNVSITAPEGKHAPNSKMTTKFIKHTVTKIEQIHLPAIKIASDGQRQLFTVRLIKLQENPELVFNTSLADLEDSSENQMFTIKLDMVASLKTTNDLQTYINNAKEWINQGRKIPNEATKLDQIYNIVLKSSPLFRFIPIGRASFFPEPSGNGDGFGLGGGLVNWPGHSLIMNFGSAPYVNIDMTNATFVRAGPVYKVLSEVLETSSSGGRDIRQWSENDFIKANQFLTGLQIKYKWHNGDCGTRKISGVTRKHAEQHQFTINLNKKTDVFNYALKMKGTTLRNKFGLCLQIGETAIIPAEICTIVKGQTKQIPEQLKSNLIKHTAKPPKERFQHIRKSLELNAFDDDGVLKEFGMAIGKELLEDEGRILPRPTIVYGNRNGNANGGSDMHKQQKLVHPGKDGIWSSFNPKLKFVEPFNNGKVVKWGVIQVRCEMKEENLISFLDEVIGTSKGTGFNLGRWRDVHGIRNEIVDGQNDEELKIKLERTLTYFSKAGCKFVVVIVPDDKQTKIYEYVKHCAEVLMENGILTQCVRRGTAINNRKDAVRNIVSKLHAKLGGINYYVNPTDGFPNIDIRSSPIMIVGADVNHPTATSDKNQLPNPSVAAVTATIHGSGMPYMMHSQAQQHKKSGAAEIIENMGTIMVGLLKGFIRQVKCFPRKILYFRDGVGESQFQEILTTEMLGIRAACVQIQNDPEILALAENETELPAIEEFHFEPKITVVVVQKRHGTRIMPKDPKDGIGAPSKGNAPPGTVYDREIVSAVRTNFILLGHVGIQGTSRPTRYQVLWDDSDFTMDELQLMTYQLCYMSCRCTRSVSYPAPTYYAHRAASRARIYVDQLDKNVLGNLEEVNALIQRQPFANEFPMHFM